MPDVCWVATLTINTYQLCTKLWSRGTIQDGWSLTSWDCSSQLKRREREDATLSDKIWSLTEQKIPSGGVTRVASATLVAGAEVLPAPWRGSSWSRVNGTGSPSDRGWELQEGRVAYYRFKKEARLEIPGQKSTINLNAAVLASTVGCSDSSAGNQQVWCPLRDLIWKLVITKMTGGSIYNDGKKPA